MMAVPSMGTPLASTRSSPGCTPEERTSRSRRHLAQHHAGDDGPIQPGGDLGVAAHQGHAQVGARRAIWS